MRQLRRRIEKIAMSFPAKPKPPREQMVKQMASRLTPGEDLMVLRRIMKAGRPLLAATEQESQAIAAYESAFEKATSLIKEDLKRQKKARPKSIPLQGGRRRQSFEVSV